MSSLSVIIPTYNAASSLEGLLAQLDGHADDLIIADGGSQDDTLKCAVPYGARFALGMSGRGRQLARGAGWSEQTGRPDWLLFLHADSPLARWMAGCGSRPYEHTL